jgi:hypothetical protein
MHGTNRGDRASSVQGPNQTRPRPPSGGHRPYGDSASGRGPGRRQAGVRSRVDPSLEPEGGAGGQQLRRSAWQAEARESPGRPGLPCRGLAPHGAPAGDLVRAPRMCKERGGSTCRCASLDRSHAASTRPAQGWPSLLASPSDPSEQRSWSLGLHLDVIANAE